MYHSLSILINCTVIAVLQFLFIMPSISVGDPCFSECSCKWKNGKQTVECVGVNLVGIPDGLSGETQVLDLTGNLLQLFPSRAFHRSGLVNLQKVYASHCGLLTIAEDAFYQLSNLVELDMSSNFITWIPAVALRDTPLLRRLLLNSNPIQRIENDTFSLLAHLTVLELSSCQIEAIEPKAFDGLKSLEYLMLDGNRLRTLPPEITKPLSKLYALDLHQNPWQCDCSVRAVRVWMMRQNIPISNPPQCSEPSRLRGQSWNAVSIDDFACKPSVTVVESVTTYAEGDNATLGCRVQAVPEGTVNWFWRGRMINNLTLMSFGRQMYLIREVGTTLKVNSLTIFNVMLKDSGRYLCVASNPAGTISANISLNVIHKENDNNALSGEEIAGIVIGVLFVIFALFFVFSFFLIRHQRHFPNRSKDGGFTVYKNFFSFNNNHVDAVVKNSTNLDAGVASNPSDVVDNKCDTLSPGSGGSGTSAYSANKMNSLVPLEQYSLHENADVSPSGVVEKWYSHSLNRHLVRETEKGIEMYALPPEDAGNGNSRIFTEKDTNGETHEMYLRKVPEEEDDEDDVDNIPMNVGLDMGSDTGPVVYDLKQPVNEAYYLESNLPEHKCPIWPISEGSYKEESYQSYNSPSQSSWKRNSVVIPQQIHHIFSPDARDSPDEGLGDEREYETDILD